MSTLDLKKEKSGIAGFFTIYKPGQGKWVRWGTVVALGIVILSGAWYVAQVELSVQDVLVQTGIGALLVLLGAFGTFWLVNSPKMAEFMIMTESEMRKVTWPTRREVITSTKVVILVTIILGVLLYLVDVGFLAFFKWIEVA